MDNLFQVMTDLVDSGWGIPLLVLAVILAILGCGGGIGSSGGGSSLDHHNHSHRSSLFDDLDYRD